MAALDFPANPTAGQVYEGDNGVIYTYVGTAPNGHWSAFAELSSESFADIFVEVKGDNMTGDLTLGTDKITLNAADGSITAAGDVLLPTGKLETGDWATNGGRVNANGAVSVNRSASDRSLFLGYLNSSQTFGVAADGSITAAGNATIGNSSNANTSLFVTANGVSGFFQANQTNGDFRYGTLDGADLGLVTDVTRRAVLDTNGNFLVGNVDNNSNSPYIKLAANGSADFAGNVKVGSASAGSAAGIGARVDSYGYIMAQRDGSGPNPESNLLFEGYYGSDNVFSVTGDGSAEFAGEVTVGSDAVSTNGAFLSPNGVIRACRDGTNSIFVGRSTTLGLTSQIDADGTALFGGTLPSAPNISLNAGGNITTVGAYTANRGTSGEYSVLQPSGWLALAQPTAGNAASNIAIRINGGSAENILMYTDGSATFAGSISTKGFTLQDNNFGCYRLLKTSTQAVLELKHGNGATAGSDVIGCYSGDEKVAKIGNDGSAQFAGGKATIGSIGDITVSGPNTGSSFASNFASGTTGNHLYGSFNSAVNVQIKHDGSAEFGNVRFFDNRVVMTSGMGLWFTADSLVPTLGDSVGNATNGAKDLGSPSTRWRNVYGTTARIGNVVLELDQDDDTKYTSTTNEEGEQTLVYNGAVLDVKERLQKTDAALTALKSAAAAASDFAALKSAIATALADI